MKIPKALINLLIAALLFCTGINAQNTPKTDTVKTAQVIVTVVNAKKQPRKGEQVILQSQKSKKAYIGKTDAAGRATLTLPAGEDYLITLKAFTDSTEYGNFSIPPLGPAQYYKDPLTIDITFEPARTFTLDGLQFDVAKATIRPSSFPQLEELLEYLQWKTDTKIEIDGHTDNTGKDADNLLLSQQRSDAVKAWLVKKGITADRIIAKGFGATQPVADNSDEDGRQRNRRIELKIL